MKAPTVVHHDKTETETAILCADGRVHCGPEYVRGVDAEKVRVMADEVGAQPDVTWCGGVPHVIATRQRITTAWTPV